MRTSFIPIASIASLLLVTALPSSSAHSQSAQPSHSLDTASIATQHWRAAALLDVEAMYGQLFANHPGTVDPQNKAFAVQLEQGHKQALRDARRVRTQADYVRTLRRYANGFRDGHLVVSFSNVQSSQWPGFLARENRDGTLSVNVAGPDSPVADKTVILSCDGKSGTQLINTLVAPYRINAGIPISVRRRFHLYLWLRPMTPLGRDAAKFGLVTAFAQLI
jgi:hypothetical protein